MPYYVVEDHSISTPRLAVHFLQDHECCLKHDPNVKCSLHLRDRPIFFDQVGHKTTNASIGNKHFFTIMTSSDLHTKIMNNLVKDLKILSFKVIFQCLKLVEYFQKEIL